MNPSIRNYSSYFNVVSSVLSLSTISSPIMFKTHIPNNILARLYPIKQRKVCHLAKIVDLWQKLFRILLILRGTKKLKTRFYKSFSLCDRVAGKWIKSSLEAKINVWNFWKSSMSWKFSIIKIRKNFVQNLSVLTLESHQQ